MSEEMDLLEKIERYTKGELGEEERRAFESQLETDLPLRKRLEASLAVEQIIIGYEALKLKEQMQKDLSAPKSAWKTYLPMALLVVGVGAALYTWQSQETAPVKEEAKKTEGISLPAPDKKQEEMSSPSGPGTIEKPDKNVTTQLKEEAPVPTVLKESPMPEKAGIESALPMAMPPTAPASSEKASHPVKQAISLPEKGDPCNTLQANVDFSATPSCAGAETGTVRVDPASVKGGTSPFVFLLGEKSAPSFFEHLAPGKYRLFVRDARGCTAENGKEVVVPSMPCKQSKQVKEFTFNPEYDPTWQIPYEREKEATSFRILDKAGNVFFRTTVVGGHPTDWRGESSTGQPLGLGLYFFAIDYADGSMDEGTIVITR